MDNSQPISRNRIPTVVKVYTHQSDWSKNMLYYSKGTVLNYGWGEGVSTSTRPENGF